MKRIILIILIISTGLISSQNIEINKVEPPNWWLGHTYDNLILMIYGKNLDDIQVHSTSQDFTINSVINSQNSSYSFIDVTVGPDAKEGDQILKFSNSIGSKELLFPLYKRDYSLNKHNGFSNEDVVYLIFPDRFVNGDTGNDFLFNEKEEYEFGSLNGRHGGDIQGMIDKLEYLEDLGITAIWSTPLLKNNMYMSYHGYAATNFYQIDPRHGTNELYREFVQKAHEKGIKVIYDHVANHIGINHDWVENLPTRTWINGIPGNHLPANHNKIVYVDPYASSKSLENANDGWFEDYMPDLNQRDSLLAKYIIQNTIWWIEFSGIDGIREDTYPYSNPHFMAEWAATILEHYPRFNIVGEVWKGEPSVLAAYQTNNYFKRNYDTNLPVVTDFAFKDKITDYFLGKSDLNVIYELLGKDFIYSDPDNLLVFFDNHDVDRGMYTAKWNLHKYKVALTLTLTTRGIPQLFYGTEIGLDGGGHHGKIRAPFPGGFPKDVKNAFTEEGRSNIQNEIFNFLSKLLNLRKKYKVLGTGKLTQFPLDEGIYAYTKSDNHNEIVVIINDSDQTREIVLSEYSSKDIKNHKVKRLFTEEILTNGKNKLIKLANKSIDLYLIE